MKKKLQLKKETIAILNGESMTKVIAGGMACMADYDCPDGMACVEGQCSPTTIISIITVISAATTTIEAPTGPNNSCLTCLPGHQDSCGLCDTRFACPPSRMNC